MRYIVSDIHGCYNQYRALLEKIHFSDAEELLDDTVAEIIVKLVWNAACSRESCRVLTVFPLDRISRIFTQWRKACEG